VPYRFRFVAGADGRPTRLAWVHDGDTYDYNAGPDDPPGPSLKEWSMYIRLYSNKYTTTFLRIGRKNGSLFLKWVGFGSALRLDEYHRGLFFTSTGEAVDFTGEMPLFAGNPLIKSDPGPLIRNNLFMLTALLWRWMRKSL
jgi:hypothetical protein